VVRKRNRAKPSWVKKIAEKRVETLLEMAEKELDSHPERSKKYAKMALNNAVKYNLKLPEKYRDSVCKKCGSLLIPGKTLKVRTDAEKKAVILTCTVCGNTRKKGYSKEKLNKPKNA
jgi:RNase P subunit RPR2